MCRVDVDVDKRTIRLATMTPTLREFLSRVGANDVTGDNNVWFISPLFDLHHVARRVMAILEDGV